MAEKKDSVVLRRESEVKVSLKLRIMDALNGPLRILPVIFALIVIWVVFTLLRPAFISPRNLTILSVQIVTTGVMAVGLFFVLLHGELDLSCAASSVACASIGSLLYAVVGVPFIVAFLATILTGALIGAIMGWIVTTFKAPAFIITMGFQYILTGLVLVLLSGGHMQISLIDTPMVYLTTHYLPMWLSYVLLAAGVLIVFVMKYSSYKKALQYGLKTDLKKNVIIPVAAILAGGVVVLEIMRQYRGLSVSVLVLILLLAVMFFLLTQTRFGVHLYALGGNPEAVRRAGINVKNTKWAAFILSGAIIAFAGFLGASRAQSVSTTSIDDSLMMNSLAACVLGGASLSGGRGNIWGILLGALVMGSLTNGLYLIGAETFLRLFIQGAILVAAIVLDSVIAKSTAR